MHLIGAVARTYIEDREREREREERKRTRDGFSCVHVCVLYDNISAPASLLYICVLLALVQTDAVIVYDCPHSLPLLHYLASIAIDNKLSVN